MIGIDSTQFELTQVDLKKVTAIMLYSLFNFVISQSLRKQTSLRWSLVTIYLILIFPTLILMSIAQNMEKGKKGHKLLQESILTKALYYAFYFSPTMFLSCALAIASTGSTFAAYIPLFWFISCVFLLFGKITTYYIFRLRNKRQKQYTQKHTQ